MRGKLVSIWGRLSLLLLPVTSFVIGRNTNLPAVFLFLFFLFFPYNLTNALSFTLTFPSMSVFWEFTKSLYMEFPFPSWAYFSRSPKLSRCHVSQSSLLTVVTCPVINVSSHLAYSAVSKEYLNFAGGFLKSSLFAYVLLLTFKSVLV